MSQTGTIEIDASELLALISPALNCLWSIHLDIPEHPYCPMRPAAEKGINGLTILLNKVKGLTPCPAGSAL